MRESVQNFIRYLGYDIKRIKRQQSTEKLPSEVDEFIRTVQQNTMLSRHRLESLYDMALFFEQQELEGAFVECGVWKGGAVGMMALVNKKHGKNKRHLHLFDTFEGIPEPDESVDGKRAVDEANACGVNTQGKLISNPQFYENMGRDPGSLEDCRHLLEKVIGYDSNYIHYHKGFFQKTVPDDANMINGISVLRLDGDWYASTKVCIEHLYDLVIPGGLIIVDDYAAYNGCKKAIDEFFRSRDLKVYLHKVDNEVRAFSKIGL